VAESCFYAGRALQPLNLKGDAYMRNRSVQLNIRLTPAEFEQVKRNSMRTHLSVSGYIRMLINGYVPKETPPIEYNKLMDTLNVIYSGLRNEGYKTEASVLRQTLLKLQAELTLPERM
jgi:hypothetical protein